MFCLFLQNVKELKQSVEFRNIELTVEEMKYCIKEVLLDIQEIQIRAGVKKPSSLKIREDSQFVSKSLDQF